MTSRLRPTSNVEGCDEATAPQFRRRGSAAATIDECEQQGLVGGAGAGAGRNATLARRRCSRPSANQRPPRRRRRARKGGYFPASSTSNRSRRRWRRPRPRRDASGKTRLPRPSPRRGRRRRRAANSRRRRVFQEPAVGWRGLDETGVAAGAKPARKIAKAEPFAARAAAPEAVAAPEATLEKAPAERAGERQARHRRILDRYVLGAELKPGERWKKRLHKAR